MARPHDGDENETPAIDLAAARRRMVADQLAARDITDDRILEAMTRVPRSEFVPRELIGVAHEDRPLPIGHGATISQPYIVALMAQELRLRPTDRVLDVGTGSGYGAAVLAELCAHVTTIETVEELADLARIRLAHYGDRVEVVTGDGSKGYAAGAPFDAIVVGAAAPSVPPPLLDQLAPGGRLVMPVGPGQERLVRVTRTADGIERAELIPVSFVPLVGEHGVVGGDHGRRPD